MFRSVQVARGDSVTRAAETLGISQTSVSHQPAGFEEYFGR
ncbi:LysR family transcriptional regulator [Phyllobacterium zundukense]|uniref:LysR family transcriptional regulator n=1 Tax=Phyllobacterium zundukense TaxID=1867719 RepID=A0ACD4CW86_9HYPH|nr:LysR family transcriptional regulator [Phyllobacterium zundukense]UXN57836.1 LysR family transcriptional regulator [Phyllobacterium zundukense]